VELNAALIGATGAVGEVFLRVAEQREFPVKTLKLLASPRSAGKLLPFRGESVTVEAVSREALEGVDMVFCAASSEVSKQWAPVVRELGAVMIDKGSAFRMDPTVPLVVPEVNADDLDWHDGLIATPNCTSTPLVISLHALRQVAPLRRVTAATYQAVSGTGAEAVAELRAQVEAIGCGRDLPPIDVYPQQIAMNVLPHVDDFVEEEDFYTKEELKMRNETRKILHEDELPVATTCVRVPTMVGHAEAVHVEFASEAPMAQLREALQSQEGLELLTDPTQYITPLQAEGDDRTFVSRLRRDPTVEHGVVFWCVADNLRKGAATNAIQIAEELIRRGKLKR
jgi:aspartate-semialdehyde dehydrogenase